MCYKLIDERRHRLLYSGRLDSDGENEEWKGETACGQFNTNLIFVRWVDRVGRICWQQTRDKATDFVSRLAVITLVQKKVDKIWNCDFEFRILSRKSC